MAIDKKISELTELAAAPAADDMLLIVDTSASDNKKISASNLGGGAWTTYTPTWTLIGAASQACTSAGAYVQIGKTVHFWARMTVNASSNFSGLTSVYGSYPVTASSGWNTIAMAFGGGKSNAGGGGFFMSMWGNSTTTFQAIAHSAGGTYVGTVSITGSIPAGWSSGQYFTVSGTYEAA